MREMDFYSFINSKDMQSYLKKIGYQFSAPEAAFLVYYSDGKSLKEKMQAWEEIISVLPDCPMEKRTWFEATDSFHNMLSNYMELQKRKIEVFSDGDGYIYRYATHEPSVDNGLMEWFDERDAYFTYYDACIQYCKKNELMNEKMDAIKIYKCKLNPVENDFGENRAGGYIILSRQWEVLEVETSLAYDSDIYTLDLDSIFGGMCFNFPAPFKRGDIVIAYGENDCWNTPFVFSYISTWSSKEMMNKGFLRHECPYRKGWEDFDKCRERLLKLGDSTDMHVLGTYADQGKFYRDNILILPTDLEYYTGELQGYSRQLKPLSLYEKGEIDYELLVNSCFSIRTEEMAKEVRADCILPYYQSTMEELGVIPDREGKEN